MSDYQIYPVVDFKTGLYTAKDAWLAPDDAFPVLKNAYIDKGVLKKRAGYSLLASTGAGLPIMGIGAVASKGYYQLIACDTKRIYYLSFVKSTGIFSLTDLIGSDVFSGTDRYYFGFQEYLNKLYFTNGKSLSLNRIYCIDPAAGFVWPAPIAAVSVLDTLGAATIPVTYTRIWSCKILFVYKSRLLFVSPYSDLGLTINNYGWQPQTLCYSDVLLTTVSAANWVNAPTDDVPVTGGYLNGEPIVIMRNSIWRIVYTQNTDAPFAWEKLTDSYGAITRLGAMCATSFKDNLAFIGHHHLLLYDRYQAQEYDIPIHGVVDDMSFTAGHSGQAITKKSENAIYVAYNQSLTGVAGSGNILRFNGDEGNFAKYDIPAHCLFSFDGAHASGNTGEEGGVNPADIWQYLFAGTYDGKIILLNSGTDDNTAKIAVDIRSAQLNPFQKQGLKAKFGWMMVLVTTSTTASYTVNFYKDTKTTAFKTVTMTCTGGGDKHWERINADGEVANFFRIQFSHTEKANAPEIHAVLFAFKPAGRLDTLLAVAEEPGPA